MNVQSVLVVDDEPLMRDFVGETLTRMGCDVKFATDGTQAIRLIESNQFDLVITDMKLPKLSGIDVLKSIKQLSPETESVLMTAYGTIQSAVEAMKSGACDYLLKPFTPDQIEILVEKISSTLSLKAQNEYLKREIDASFGFGEIVGVSKSLQDLYKTIKKVADSTANILISGESGTGKELVARAVHYNSDRRDKPFIKLNCASLPANLIESELFGHEKGSFTGAVSKRTGRFELANGGTIFLDEISEIAPQLQSKLLRVLQERELERVGSAKTIKIDVRVLASTNRDLKKEIAKGDFREDLFYRLNVIPIHLPPLRERKNDIKILSEHFLKRFVTSNKKNEKSFSEDALKDLEKYNWPGNIRELENIIERAVVMDRDSIVDAKDFGLYPKGNTSNHTSDLGKYSVGKKMSEIEKEYILDSLRECNDNRTKTAQILDISIRTLRNKLKEYRITSDD